MTTLPADRDYSTNELAGIATLNLIAAALDDIIDNKLARRLTDEEKKLLNNCRARVDATVKAAFDRIPDPDRREGLARRMLVMKLNVGYTDHRPDELVCLSVPDASTLVGHALNYCEYECPCVQVDEHTGERTVCREAVRRCEMARLYRRMMLVGGDVSAECPYSVMV